MKLRIITPWGEFQEAGKEVSVSAKVGNHLIGTGCAAVVDIHEPHADDPKPEPTQAAKKGAK